MYNYIRKREELSLQIRIVKLHAPTSNCLVRMVMPNFKISLDGFILDHWMQFNAGISKWAYFWNFDKWFLVLCAQKNGFFLERIGCGFCGLAQNGTKIVILGEHII